jgi:hypothetical protein
MLPFAVRRLPSNADQICDTLVDAASAVAPCVPDGIASVGITVARKAPKNEQSGQRQSAIPIVQKFELPLFRNFYPVVR